MSRSNVRSRNQDAALQELLRPGQSLELLKELHILTRDGGLNQDSRRKLKEGVQNTAPVVCDRPRMA